MILDLKEILEERLALVDPVPTFHQALRKGFMDSGGAVVRFTNAQGRGYACLVLDLGDGHCLSPLAPAEALLRLLDQVPREALLGAPYLERK